MSEYFQFNLHGYLSVLSGFLFLGLGFLVFLKNIRSKINFFFFLFSVVAFFWVMGFGMVSLVRSPDNGWIWLSLAFAGVPFISPSIFFFSEVWRKGNISRNWIILGLLAGMSSAIPGVFATRSVASIAEYDWGRYSFYHPSPITTFFLFTLLSFFFLFAFLSLKNFILGFRETKDPFKKSQYRNIFIGFLIAYTGGWDFLVYFIGGYPFGYISLSIHLFITSYTIVRHRFLDINIVLKRLSFLVLIYLGLIGFVFVIGYPAFSHFSSQADQLSTETLFFFTVTVGLILSMGPLLYAYLVNSSFWLKSTLSAGLTHELKSPIFAIDGALEVLRENIEVSKTSKATPFLDMIQRNTMRLSNAVNNLLNLARIKEGDIQIIKDDFDLTFLITQEIAHLKFMAEKKGLSFIYQENEPFWVKGDQEKIQQVISNLLLNATRYSDAGSILISQGHEGESIKVSVNDKGKGISSQNLDKIFDPYFKGTTSSKTGSGLGLSIAKTWIESHGGRIWAESGGEGEGTKISFTLPC